jgi:hypothetical protein
MTFQYIYTPSFEIKDEFAKAMVMVFPQLRDDSVTGYVISSFLYSKLNYFIFLCEINLFIGESFNTKGQRRQIRELRSKYSLQISVHPKQATLQKASTS